MTKITKDTIIKDILKEHILLPVVFDKYGMGCAKCSMNAEETLEQGAKLHNVDVEMLLQDIQKFLK